MNNLNTKSEWDTYCTTELETLVPILNTHGYTLDTEQKHIGGERYLMQAVTTTSGRKLILLGMHRDGTRVIIKATRDILGIREIAHEQECRQVLHEIDFAAGIFYTPDLVDRFYEHEFLIMVTRFIPQEKSFLERPIREQFDLALRSFIGQEGAHATTFKHRTRIADTFGIRDASTYLLNFDIFKKNICAALPHEEALGTVLNEAEAQLGAHRITIEQYCGFLTHTDFVPHNFRIEGDKVILLDHSSLTFGNKYEGWARFLNFMTLYNPSLERVLVEYVQNNRTPEESISLRMMRIYRLGEIIWYYVRTLGASSDNLLALNTTRVHFWTDVLGFILKNEHVPEEVITLYTQTRDSLRSTDKKRRQQGLH